MLHINIIRDSYTTFVYPRVFLFIITHIIVRMISIITNTFIKVLPTPTAENRSVSKSTESYTLNQLSQRFRNDVQENHQSAYSHFVWLLVCLHLSEHKFLIVIIILKNYNYLVFDLK